MIQFMTDRHRPFHLRVVDCVRRMNLDRPDMVTGMGRGSLCTRPIADDRLTLDLVQDLYTMLLHKDPEMEDFVVLPEEGLCLED